MKTRTRKFISHSEKETMDFAASFGKELKPGSVVALEGNLGSGKTTFIKGIARALGLGDPHAVKSPTFALMHVYPTKIPLYHFDLYRLDSAKDLESVGLDEFLNDSTAISCVEWAEKAKNFLPLRHKRVHLEIAGEHARKITLL